MIKDKIIWITNEDLSKLNIAADEIKGVKTKFGYRIGTMYFMQFITPREIKYHKCYIDILGFTYSPSMIKKSGEYFIKDKEKTTRILYNKIKSKGFEYKWVSKLIDDAERFIKD